MLYIRAEKFRCSFVTLTLFNAEVPKIPEMNLAFAISARAEDDASNFEKMKDIIKAIVQKFGSNRIHYGVITFGDPFTTELSFDRQLPSDEDLERFIGKSGTITKVLRSCHD